MDQPESGRRLRWIVLGILLAGGATAGAVIAVRSGAEPQRTVLPIRIRSTPIPRPVAVVPPPAQVEAEDPVPVKVPFVQIEQTTVHSVAVEEVAVVEPVSAAPISEVAVLPEPRAATHAIDPGMPDDHPARDLPPLATATGAGGVPIATLDVDRMLALKPLRPGGDIPTSSADGQGTFTKDGDRLRFDCQGDWVSLMDRLNLPTKGDVEVAFELEFDHTPEGKPDVTAFWGAGPDKDGGHGPITGSWTGYELKLGGPGRDEMKYKEGGYRIEANQTPVFQENTRHQVEIRQLNGRMTLTVDGVPTMQAHDPDAATLSAGPDQRRGFGLMFWHTAGWVGPIQIRTPTGTN